MESAGFVVIRFLVFGSENKIQKDNIQKYVKFRGMLK